MHSMSGTRDHGGGQLYGDHRLAAGSVPLYDGEDAGSVFFQTPACGVGGDAGGGLTPSYSSITDYLQGFLDPAELSMHLDGESAVGDMIGHGGQHERQAGGGAAPPSTNSSMSNDPPRCKRGTPAPEEGDEEGAIDEEGSADHQNSREEKEQKKGKSEKKARGSRVAFATKSEVDHLDDGYRWRKYGQKAVKNSSFPRSYYRCTAARCGVKKQVERSQQDPATVVTTYEGHHAHPSPAAHRGMATGLYSLASFQQQQHPSSPDDLLLAAAMAPPAVLLPRQAEHRFTEYYGMQLQDGLLDPLAGNQHGHR